MYDLSYGGFVCWFSYWNDVFLLQYGSEEFGQDSPRYTSPKATAALYASDPYYLGEYPLHG